MIDIQVVNGQISLKQEISFKLFIPTGNTLVKVKCIPSYKSEINTLEDMICDFLNKQSIDKVPIFTNHVTSYQSIETKEDGTYINEITFQVFINDIRL